MCYDHYTTCSFFVATATFYTLQGQIFFDLYIRSAAESKIEQILHTYTVWR